MPKLTKRVIDSTTPKSKEEYSIWDDEIKGFFCRIHPSGKKVYYFSYYTPQKKRAKLKIGVHGHITCDIARETVKGWAGDLSRGIDPRNHKSKQESEDKKSIAFAEFFELFIEQHSKPHYTEITQREDKYRIKNHILPFFGKKILSEITEKDILEFKSHLKRCPATYNRCVNLVSSAFSFAELGKYRPDNSNPCRKVRRYPEKSKERFLDENEIKRIHEVIKAQEILGNLSPYALAAIQILLYTGCRRGEVLHLKWESVFLDKKYFHIPFPKEKTQKSIPLNEFAIDIFKKLERKPGNPYVFVGEKPGAPLPSVKSQWRKILRLSGVGAVRIHDLRHTFASLALEEGLDLFQVSKLLGHKNIQSTMRYAHIARKKLLQSTQVVGEVFQRVQETHP